MSPAAIIGTALRADAARNRARVLEAAAELFGARGLDVSMQDVADAAGVGVGTVFRRFSTKDDLVAAILLDGIERLVQLGEDAIERAAHEPWDAFASYFLDATELHVRHRGIMESIGTEHVAHPAMDEVRGRLVDMLRRLVAHGHDASVLRRDVVAEDIPMLQCAISRTSCMPIAAAEPDSWRRAALLLLDGMRTDSATTSLEPVLPSFEQALEHAR